MSAATTPEETSSAAAAPPRRRVEIAKLPALGAARAPAVWPAKVHAAARPASENPPAVKRPQSSGKIQSVSAGDRNVAVSSLATGVANDGTPVPSVTESQAETHSLTLPGSARGTIIGPRGATLRRLEQQFNVSIAVSRHDRRWSLALIDVHIAGARAAAALLAVRQLVTLPSRVTASRTLPALIAPFFPRDKYEVDLNSHTVEVSGSFEHVLEEMHAVDELADKISGDLETTEVEFDKPFKACIPAKQFLTKYGAVVSEKDGLYTVIAAPPQLPAATSALRKCLAGQVCEVVDAASVFSGFAGHAKMLTRYFALTHELENLGDDVVVTSGETYTISGEKQAVDAAKRRLLELLYAHSPSAHVAVKGMRFPLCRSVAARAAAGVTMPIKVVWSNSDEIYIVHTDPTLPKNEIKESVLDALAKFAVIEPLRESLRAKTVDLTHPEYIASPMGEEAQKLLATVCTSSGDLDDTRARFEVTKTSVVLTGSKEAVNRAAAVLPQVVKLSQKYAVLSSHTEEFAFDDSLMATLVGRGGVQINSLRKQFGVKIEAGNGRVSVQGVPSAVREAVSTINDLQRKWRDTKAEKISVPKIYLPQIIGAGGKNVRKLTEKYACSIDIPNVKPTDVEDGIEAAKSLQPAESDTNLEVAIAIRGSSKNVNAVKAEIQAIVNYEREHAHVELLQISSESVPRVLGKGGATLNRIVHDTKADVRVPTRDSESQESVDVRIKGTKKQVEEASRLIQDIVRSVEDYTELTISVPEEIIKLLNQEKRAELVQAAGGDPLTAYRHLIVLARSRTLRLMGEKPFVESLKSSIESLVSEHERKTQFKTTLSVPPIRIREFVRDEMSLVHSTEKEYQVLITLGKRTDGAVPVTVRGETQEAVDQAIKHLTEEALLHVRELNVVASAFTNQVRRSVASQYHVRIESGRGESVTSKTDVTTKRLIYVCGKTEESVEKCTQALKPLEGVSHCATFSVGDKMRSLIGRQGETIKKLRAKTPAIIELEDDVVYIYGDEDSTATAVVLVKEKLE